VGNRRREKILNRKSFLRANQGHNALMGRGAGELGKLFAGFLTDADTGQTAVGNEMSEAFVVALGGYQHLVETAAAGLESFGNRMHAIEDFHEE
jgi:hypothetical protein